MLTDTPAAVLTRYLDAPGTGRRIQVVSMPRSTPGGTYRVYVIVPPEMQHDVITYPAQLVDITHLAADVTGHRYNNRSNTLSMPGTGYNRAAAIAESLGLALYENVRAIRADLHTS